MVSCWRPNIGGLSEVYSNLQPSSRAGRSHIKAAVGRASRTKVFGALTTAPVLGLGEFNKPFVVTTEAIDGDVGAILEQGLGDGPQPIPFASRQLHQAEVHYSSNEHALIGIV